MVAKNIAINQNSTINILPRFVLPSIQSGNIDFSKSKQEDTTNTKEIEDKSFLGFEPWKKSPKGFAIDVLFSALTYVITYWFLHRIGILHMKGFNNHIREKIKQNYKSKDLINKKLADFEKVLKKSISLNPKGSDKYWKEYYNKYVLDKSQSKELTKWQRFCARTFKVVYSFTNGYGRLAYVSLVILISLIRAYAVHPDLSIFKACFISLGPIITQLIYRRYDAQTLNKVSSNELQRLNDFGELSNFGFKWLSKALKRSESKLTFSVALIGSFFSRFVRDSVEGGFPSNGKNGDKLYHNPVFRPFGKLPLMNEIRDSSNIFKDGILDKYNHGEHHITYLARVAGMKTALKYLTDYLVFGLGGVALLKLAYFLKHLFEESKGLSIDLQSQSFNSILNKIKAM